MRTSILINRHEIKCYWLAAASQGGIDVMSWGSRREILQTLKGVFCMCRRACRLSMEALKKYKDETLSASLLRRPRASINSKVCTHGKRHSVGLAVINLWQQATCMKVTMRWYVAWFQLNQPIISLNKLVLKSVAKRYNRQSYNLVVFWRLSHLSDFFLCCIQAMHELPTAQSSFSHALNVWQWTQSVAIMTASLFILHACRPQGVRIFTIHPLEALVVFSCCTKEWVQQRWYSLRQVSDKTMRLWSNKKAAVWATAVG